MSGPRGAEIYCELAGLSHFMSELPKNVTIDGTKVPATSSWVASVLKAQSHAFVFWEDTDRQLCYSPRSGPLASAGVPVEQVRLPDALKLVEPLPFELCSFGSMFQDEWIAADYEHWGFSRSHISFGWGCAFRGAGHERLVSKRWLDFGPWRVLRRSNETTLVQFHDLALTDPREAYEQAKAGHERMSEGFLHHNFAELIDEVRGLYLAEERRLEIVVAPGLEVSQYQMRCAAALRLHGKLNPQGGGNPVEKIAYVFLDEAQARAHLHELWLRELECWVVDDKGKRRLDDAYRPIPEPPAWVQRLGEEI